MGAIYHQRRLLAQNLEPSGPIHAAQSLANVLREQRHALAPQQV